MRHTEQMSVSEFIKHTAENELKFTLSEDNRKYPFQQCQDEYLNQEFRILHKNLVNMVINFCNTHNIIIDEFRLTADELGESIKSGSWQASTDSCLTFDKFSQEYKDVVSMNKIASNEEFNKIVAKEEPFLISL